MIRDIASFIFSMFDCAAIMVLIMAVFRIEIRRNVLKMIMANILYTTFSVLLIKIGLHTEALLFQIPAIVLIFIFIFKENKIYSIWVTVTGLTTFLMIQGLITYLLLYMDVLVPDDLQPFTVMGYVVQTSVFVICLIASLFLKKMNEGFMFNFENKFRQKKKTKPATLYIVIAIVVTIFTSIFYPQLYNSSITTSFYMTLTFSFLTFMSLLYFSIKRNQEEIQSVL